MSTQDTLVALLVLVALAVVGYTLLQGHQARQTLPAPPPAMPTHPGNGQSPIVEEDVVPPPNRPGFGYRYQDPCKVWPWLCP